MVVFAEGGLSTKYLWTLACVWWGGVRTRSRHSLQPLGSGSHPPAKAGRAGEVSLYKTGLLEVRKFREDRKPHSTWEQEWLQKGQRWA